MSIRELRHEVRPNGLRIIEVEITDQQNPKVKDRVYEVHCDECEGAFDLRSLRSPNLAQVASYDEAVAAADEHQHE